MSDVDVHPASGSGSAAGSGPSADAAASVPLPAAPTAPVPTAPVADAAVRLGVPLRWAPPSLNPLLPERPFSGPAAPVTHLGSVDVILEVIDDARPGDVLVIDNGGRPDESCIGDLIVAEAALAGIAGIVLWGLHRDTAELRRLGLPVHSLGALPTGPRRVPPAGSAMRVASIDGVLVHGGELVVADDDGVLLLPADRADEVLDEARRIQAVESRQAELMRGGRSLREQLDFAAYRAAQRADPALTLRAYLAARGAAVET
ncbi:RraA family protein [Schumannella soli]|uniref:Putative 4-hydroxy-4-methyl-2-oxoglutarate aldolase n=1 Tax=Schumannella soli TaxID=2590779 RepID=A0A506XX51_9MICO|nr:RraA family protein [Schumannella soli]TPW74262.1 RraA family protein [Schumannella soli]